jgi:hypothetical protein
MFLKLPFLLLVGMTTAIAAQEATTPSTPAGVSGPGEKPRVFITDSQSWEMRGSAGGANGAFAAHSSGGARPQTAEIIKTFGERCPDVIVNNKQELADFIVLLDHEGGKGYLQHRNKVAVFEQQSGDVVISHSTLSLGGSVQEACKGIAAHWTTHGVALIAARQKAPAPPTQAAIVAPVAIAQSAPSSQESITVESDPAGSDIEVDGEFVGNTPSTINVALGSHQITIKKKGFADWSRKVNMTGGNVHLNAALDKAN